MAMCVVINAAGLSWAMRGLHARIRAAGRTWQWTWLFIRVATGVVLLQLMGIATWAVFYAATGALPDIQSAFYFSAVTYTTTGYGDIVLPSEWQLLGAIEALTGILMCGWSTGFFFAIVSRMFKRKTSSSFD
jgi:hypothetical protein